MQYPDDRRYAENHEWVKLEGETTVRMGISEYAQDALGDIVFVDIPEVGTEVTAGIACAEVESTKSVSDVYAPVSGTVTAANTALDSEPERVNTDPYGEGWFIVIEAPDPVQLAASMENLMTSKTYAESLA